MKNRRDNEDRKPPQEVQHLNNRKSVKREDGNKGRNLLKNYGTKFPTKIYALTLKKPSEFLTQ